MMASLRAKAGGGKRSGDGRECRLLPRQDPSTLKDGQRTTPSKTKATTTKVPSRTGHGAQAAAWNSSLHFEKSPQTTITSSSSTSPETDPGTSDVFPFFKEDGAGSEDSSGDEQQQLPQPQQQQPEQPEQQQQQQQQQQQRQRQQQRPLGAAGRGVGRRPLSERRLSDAATKLDYRNPMFHAANANSEKAVASLFPADECERSTKASINGSNPMFRRSLSLDTVAARPRPKAIAIGQVTRSGSMVNGTTSSSSSSIGGGRGGGGDGAALTNADRVEAAIKAKEREERKDKERELTKTKKKKDKEREKAMYEHVGRMNIRPFIDDDDRDSGEHQHGFRVDTFARNEGEAGGKAHFKFVFTVDGAGEVPKKSRPVLDAVHERSTGNLRVRVNDGREISATGSAAVEIALANIGVVLFNPRTLAKGHHLYTLSLHGRTLFSVLA